MEGLPKAKVISLEMAMYSVPAVILFCARHHNQCIGDTPSTISRAFRKAERCGIGLAFEDHGVYDVFVMTHVANWFAAEAVSDSQMLEVGMMGIRGQCDLTIDVILLALFGENIPDEIFTAITGECPPEELGPIIANILQSRGVDWEEKWLTFKSANGSAAVATNNQ